MPAAVVGRGGSARAIRKTAQTVIAPMQRRKDIGVILSICHHGYSKGGVRSMLIGLISDTHGLLRPQTLTPLAAAELIIHAGDVGDAQILTALRAIAPVIAVRGNIDKSPALSSLPVTQIAMAGTKRIYVVHDIAELDLDPAAAGFDAVVFGHSHKGEQYFKRG